MRVGCDRNSLECELCMTELLSGQVMLQEGVPELNGQTCLEGGLS